MFGSNLVTRAAQGNIGAICMIIPLVNLITMVLMSMRATRALKAAGYKVGFMGARDI